MHPILLSPAFFSTAVILTAILIDILFGDPPTVLHPVGWQGRFISTLWRCRPQAGHRRLFLHGLFIVSVGFLLTLGSTGILQWGIRQLAGSGTSPLRLISAVLLGALLLKGAFSFRSLLNAGRSVGKALEKGNLSEARHQISFHLVSRPVDTLDASAVASAAIESLAENFTDSVAAPFFWYTIGGLPAAWCYRYVNTADAILGYRDGDKEWGGKAAARLDDILTWIPSRIAAWVIVAAAVPSGLNAADALRVMLRDARNCSSPNSGWTMAAAAGALGVRLEKEGIYVINGEGKHPDEADLRRLSRLLLWSMVIILPPLILLSAVIFHFSSGEK